MRVFTYVQVHFMKTRNVFREDLPEKMHNLGLVSGVLEHNYILAI